MMPRTVDAPTNGATVAIVKDAATALFERKLSLSQQLQCRDLLADLEAADDALIAALGQKAVFDQDMLTLKAMLADLEDMAWGTVDESNDKKRKAAHIQALRDDPVYQAKLKDYRSEMADAAALDVAIKKYERRGRRIERAIDYRTSVLNCLGA